MRTLPAVLCLVLAACGLPRDSSGTLQRVQGGLLRAGLVHNPPWVIDDGVAPRGVEPALVNALAQELGARVEWRRGAEHDLMRHLHERALDIVVGGFDSRLPWVKEAALTRPYYRDERMHVLAVPPGENAWMVRVEQTLHAREREVGWLLAEAAQP
jgi:polar amino acid transport system substrate-binding protein